MSLATDSAGNLIAQARYAPYGKLRWNGDTVMPTDYAFTGQRQEEWANRGGETRWGYDSRKAREE